jgi:hypothetical protein
VGIQVQEAESQGGKIGMSLKNWPLISVWVFVFLQIGFGIWHAISGVMFSGDPKAFASISMVYGTVAGSFIVSGLVFIQLARVITIQDTRIRSLEQLSHPPSEVGGGETPS